MSFALIRRVAMATWLAVAALVSLAIGSTEAQANPIERVMSTPTAWLYYYGMTPSQLSSVISSGYRIVDLQAESASSSGPVFTVALVANTGDYGKGWWWYYGQSIAQVSAALSANNARLISIAPYVVNGTTYFASVMVPNTGADAKSWYWWVGTAAQIQADLASSGARLVDLEPYATASGTNYVAIAIANTGADGDSWWWYLGDSLSAMSNHVSTNNAQMLVFNNEPGASTFDSTMQGGSTAPWWYYAGSDAATLSALVFENGARLTEVRSVFTNGNRTFNSVMINNSDACSTRLIGLGHGNGTGWNGNYVHEFSGSAVTDGPTPCAANDGRVYEPVSASATLIATYAWQQVQNKLAKMTDVVPVLSSTNYCNFQQVGTETLAQAITAMMQNSDNARADMLLQRYGLANITSFATSLGMTHTAFNSYIGCAGTHNTLTLDDAALLYTDLGQHTVLTLKNVNSLYAQMAGRTVDSAGMWADLQTIINEEKPAKVTAAQLQAFKDGVTLNYKSGAMTWAGGIADVNGQTEYGDIGIDGVVSLPTCKKTAVSSRQYVFGMFHESTASTADQTPVFNALGNGAELLREQVQQSLSTWNKCN